MFGVLAIVSSFGRQHKNFLGLKTLNIRFRLEMVLQKIRSELKGSNFLKPSAEGFGAVTVCSAEGFGAVTVWHGLVR